MRIKIEADIYLKVFFTFSININHATIPTFYTYCSLPLLSVLQTKLCVLVISEKICLCLISTFLCFLCDFSKFVVFSLPRLFSISLSFFFFFFQFDVHPCISKFVSAFRICILLFKFPAFSEVSLYSSLF